MRYHDPPFNHQKACVERRQMTGIESRTLKVSDRVCWNSDSNDHGTVIEVNWAGVTIKWVNRSQQTILHNDMVQIARAR